MTLAELVDSPQCGAEAIANWLVAYGRQLYYAGKPCGPYAETINGIGARRPILKRQLIGAWDLAFSWVADEPHGHHPAMPLSVLLAFVILALLWGWPKEAIIMLIWTGIMRVGEALSARRTDLVLPTDGAPGRSLSWFTSRRRGELPRSTSQPELIRLTRCNSFQQSWGA